MFFVHVKKNDHVVIKKLENLVNWYNVFNQILPFEIFCWFCLESERQTKWNSEFVTPKLAQNWQYRIFDFKKAFDVARF